MYYDSYEDEQCIFFQGDGSKDKLDKEIKNMKEECKKHMMRISELEKKLKQVRLVYRILDLANLIFVVLFRGLNIASTA